jgi:hypothetical protein
MAVPFCRRRIAGRQAALVSGLCGVPRREIDEVVMTFDELEVGLRRP